MDGWIAGRDAQLAGVGKGSGRLTSSQGNGDTKTHPCTHTFTCRHHPSRRTGGNSSPVHCANASGKAATVADSLSGWVGDSSVGVRERERLHVRLCDISLPLTCTQNTHTTYTLITAGTNGRLALQSWAEGE